MKRYRCPYCGEESITLFSKSFYYNDWRKTQYGMKIGNECPECGQHFLPLSRYMIVSKCHKVAAFIPIPLLFALSLLIDKYLLIPLILYSYLFVLFVMPIHNILFCSISQFDQENKTNIILSANAKIQIVKQSKQINNFDILGVRFRERTSVIRFHEAFTNDLVPVVFYKNDKKQKSLINVTFMKSEFIPNTLFTESSEFIVINNGKEIAQGKILEIYDKGSNIH